jgi:putative endonuclease
MYSVYAIRSSFSNRIYVGQTNKLDIRVKRHNSGYFKSTIKDCPWELIAVQHVTDRDEARRIERRLKFSLGRREAWLREHILNAYGSESEVGEQAAE